MLIIHHVSFGVKGEAIGCYQCQSGGKFPRDEDCERGSRSASYTKQCIPTSASGQGGQQNNKVITFLFSLISLISTFL